ncbi:MAG TPA: HD domain-containing phosphohydrolase [Candidatus Dormibacteraeota bacterium]|jgi:putative two-component system response regulator|nr:HD domain-containing phosphohydrolase [Candidatus Dormibacteraeota bacterium]
MSVRPGTLIGPYEVVDRIGRGGMATVYRAYHGGLDREVAIKVLPEFFAEDPEYRERFQHEARAVARLKHPNILEVFDFGNQDGTAYIVMELAEGGTLADSLGAPMRLEDVLNLLEPLAAALDYAHSRGILHRDIKPANIFLRHDGTPVLADFGLSRMAGSHPRLTASGVVMGTPEYMSPEQVGDRPLGPASDRYSFAVVAYEMFTGRVPFQSESFASVLVSQMTCPMPPARELTGELSAHVESVLRRALAKNPEERYPSALSFVLALKPAAWIGRPDSISYVAQQQKAPRSGRRLPVVLVVDDGEANRELIKACLGEVECEVRTAEDGVEALRSIERSRPDLVLLDVQMPGMDGFEVCHRIKRLDGGSLLPVVMITSLNQTSDRVRSLTSGADDYMTKPVDRIELVARVRSALKLKRVYDSLDSAERVIYALAAAVEAKDPFTEAHTLRVARSARRVGERMGLSDDELDALYRGGIIHDIGKIGVPDDILLKPGELDAEEQTRMHLHPIIGENIVAPLQTGGELLPMIRHHHERFDGSGYPDRLAGDDIPLLARILSVCDAYDALTNDRPYRPRQSHDAALAVLRQGAGRQWDPRVVRLVLEEGGRPLQEAESV